MATACEHQVGRDQHHKAKHQQLLVAHTVGELAKWIGGRSVDKVHCHHHQWYQRDGYTKLLCPQYQKRLAEPRQGERGANTNHTPVGSAQALEIFPANGVRPLGAFLAFRFAQAEHQQRHGHHARDDGHPEHGPEIIRPEQHQRDRQQGAKKRAYRVERLAQPKSRAAQVRRRDIGHQRIARRTTNTLAYAIQQAGGEHDSGAGSHRKQRLGQRTQGIPKHGKPFAFTQVVT